ncbi:hypothetical protein ACWGOQ_0007570 [Aquimarina sp. M1]
MGAPFSKYKLLKKKSFAFEHSEQENNLVILGIEVQQNNDELDIIQDFVVDDIGNISEYCKSSIRANLVITDSKILSKEVHTTGTDQEILADAYPNVDLDDFYYQILKTDTKSFVALCRKQYIHSLVDAYKKVNILITKIDLGNLTTSSLLSYLSNTELITYTAVIKNDQEKILSIQPHQDVKEDYKIGTTTISSTHTLPFSCILDTISGQSAISGNTEEKNIELFNVYKESLFFKNTLQYGISFLLISLLINFFVFNSSYKTWQGLQEEEQIYAIQKEHIKKRKSTVHTKEAIVTSILTTGFSKSSYYIDQIIQSLPSTVILKSFSYQPIGKTIRDDKPIMIKKNTLLITGNSSDKAAFTAWVDTIEDVSFVQTTTINYGWDQKNTSAFELAILLINDTEK